MAVVASTTARAVVSARLSSILIGAIAFLIAATADAKRTRTPPAPPTAAEAREDCKRGKPQRTTWCLQLLDAAEADFEESRWKPSEGPYRDCTIPPAHWAVVGFSPEKQCAYLRNIEKDPKYAGLSEKKAKEEAARAEKGRKAKCENDWSMYAGPIKFKYDNAGDHDFASFDKMPITRPWTLQALFDDAVRNVIPLLSSPPNLEQQIGPILTTSYLMEVASGEWPKSCEGYTKLDLTILKPHAETYFARIDALSAEVTERRKVEAAEKRRQKELEEAHERKVWAALKRGGAKQDTYYFGIADNVVEYGMAKVRGRAAVLETQGPDSCFVLVQTLPGGRGLFHCPGWEDEYPFTILVSGLKTKNLMHGTPLTQVGTHWVKILGFKNYRNPLGGQTQAVDVKALRGVPHPERRGSFE